MRTFKIPAVLFGGDAINALGVTRNLGRNGVDVYHVAEEKNEAVFSKYCKRSFIIPKIQEDKGRLRKFLAKFEKEISDSAVIFPGSDIFCINLSSLKNEIGDNFHFVLAKKEIVETLVNKKKFYQSLQKRMIPHPITYFPESFDDVKKISKNVDYPAYVRPSISQVFTKIFHKKGFVARSKEELIRQYKLASKYCIDVMIQEIIPGPAVNIFCINAYFNKNSSPRGFFAYRRLREWPHRFGNGSLIESVPISEVSSIKKMCVNYLQSLRYNGIMDAEFKKDSQDNHFKLLEINARSWWQNSFPTKCGINLVLMAYLDAIGDEIDYEENYEIGLKWIYFLNDLRSVIEMLRNKEITILEWLSSLHMINDWAYFSVDDPLPWILSPLFSLRKLTRRTVSRVRRAVM